MMSYVDRLNRFHRWLESHYLRASSQLLYFRLLDLFNRCGWSEWVVVDNHRLASMVQLGVHAAIASRDELVKSGLIIYEKGAKGKPNRYSLNDKIFHAKNAPYSEPYESPYSEPYESPYSEPYESHINRLRPDIDQTIIKESKDSLSIADAIDTPKTPKINYQSIVDDYNQTCTALPRVSKLSNKRKKAIRARLQDYTPEELHKVFAMAQDSGFLRGKNKRSWVASFDWLLCDANAAKVLDGNYADKGAGSVQKPSEQPLEDWEMDWMQELNKRTQGKHTP